MSKVKKSTTANFANRLDGDFDGRDCFKPYGPKSKNSATNKKSSKKK